jgi:transcriptional regulator with PAS, ATPase and Fis domain
MKTLRISALAAVNAFLLNNTRLALLITDITGKISSLSARCLEKLKIEAGSAVGKHITEILPELDFQPVISKLEKQHTELVLSDLKDTPTLYPIFNRKNELSNIICILGKEEVVTKISKYAEDRVKQTSRVTNLVRKYIRSRRKGRRE